MKKIEKFEELKPKEYFRAEDKSDGNKFVIFKVEKKDETGTVKGFRVQILRNNIGLKPDWTISFPEFRKYKWFKYDNEKEAFEPFS